MPSSLASLENNKPKLARRRGKTQQLKKKKKLSGMSDVLKNARNPNKPVPCRQSHQILFLIHMSTCSSQCPGWVMSWPKICHIPHPPHLTPHLTPQCLPPSIPNTLSQLSEFHQHSLVTSNYLAILTRQATSLANALFNYSNSFHFCTIGGTGVQSSLM